MFCSQVYDVSLRQTTDHLLSFPASYRLLQNINKKMAATWYFLLIPNPNLECWYNFHIIIQKHNASFIRCVDHSYLVIKPSISFTRFIHSPVLQIKKNLSKIKIAMKMKYKLEKAVNFVILMDIKITWFFLNLEFCYRLIKW